VYGNNSIKNLPPDEAKYVITTPDKPNTEFIVSFDDDNKKIKKVEQKR
jgi:hypothetical protein